MRRQALWPCFGTLQIPLLRLWQLRGSCASAGIWPLRHASAYWKPGPAREGGGNGRREWPESNSASSRLVIEEHRRQPPLPPPQSSPPSAASDGQGLSGLFYGIRLPARLRQTFEETLLPRGYPDTVGQNYAVFATWMSVYYTTGALNGVLSSTFMLYAVGLSSGSVPTAGALSWVLKDGVGQICTLIVGRLVSHKFDIHPKQWYVIAAIQAGTASLLELCTYAVPGPLFLPLAACANALRGLSWMATSGTRSAFVATFSKSANIADVAAKSTAQAVAASALGTATGAALAAVVRQDVHYGAALMALGVAAQIMASSKAARCVPLNTLSMDRLYAAAQSFASSDCKAVLHPASVANRESAPLMAPFCPVIYIHQLRELKRLVGWEVIVDSLREFHDETYALIPFSTKRTPWQNILAQGSSRSRVAIVMRPSADRKAIIRAVLAAAFRMDGKGLNSKQATSKAREMEERFGKLARTSGWDFSHLLIDGLEHRLEWKME